MTFNLRSNFLSIPFDPDLVQFFAIGTRRIYAGVYAGTAIFASCYAIYEFPSIWLTNLFISTKSSGGFLFVTVWVESCSLLVHTHNVLGRCLTAFDTV